MSKSPEARNLPTKSDEFGQLLQTTIDLTTSNLADGMSLCSLTVALLRYSGRWQRGQPVGQGRLILSNGKCLEVSQS